MGCDDFIQLTVWIESNRVACHAECVIIAARSNNCEVRKGQTATACGSDCNFDVGHRATIPKSNTLVEFEVEAIGIIEGCRQVVDDIDVSNHHRCSSFGTW